jgi:hypothetical protein
MHGIAGNSIDDFVLALEASSVNAQGLVEAVEQAHSCFSSQIGISSFGQGKNFC